MPEVLDPPHVKPPATPAEPRGPARERRRPGRIETVSPALIPLLRDASGAKGHDTLGAARGILVSVLLAVPLWAAIVVVVAYLL